VVRGAYTSIYESGEFNFSPVGASLSQPQRVGGLSVLGTVFRDCDGCPEMVVIPPGSFTIGSPPSEPGRSDDEGPQRQVSIARPFAAGKFEVTFDQWDACVRESGCTHKPDDQGWGRGRQPVINVSWDDAKQYTAWLSRKTGKLYRLLTEAEWEYVARAGTTTAFSFGNGITPQLANYDTNVALAGSLTATSAGKTVPVGSYPANAFGLHDVHGNVWEWTEGCWSANYNGALPDGTSWSGGNCYLRVLRGGSWLSHPQFLRSALRNGSASSARSNNSGFRVSRTD
jgi:formylglycine-generating enzyme required for sulfatase activity